jgi:hypothetical protein
MVRAGLDDGLQDDLQDVADRLDSELRAVQLQLLRGEKVRWWGGEPSARLCRPSEALTASLSPHPIPALECAAQLAQRHSPVILAPHCQWPAPASLTSIR